MSLRRRSVAMAALLLSALLTMFAGVAAVSAAPSPAASELIALTNATRAGVGAEPLAHDDAVQAVAQAWAEHLAETGSFEHNPDMSTQVPAGWSAVGENIAAGTNSTPARMHQMWLDSPGHYENIVNPRYNVIGIGYAIADDGTAYGVEVFALYENRAPVATSQAPSNPVSAPAEETPVIEQSPVTEVTIETEPDTSETPSPAEDATAAADPVQSAAETTPLPTTVDESSASPAPTPSTVVQPSPTGDGALPITGADGLVNWFILAGSLLILSGLAIRAYVQSRDA